MIIIILIEGRKSPLFTLLHLNKLESPSPRMLCANLVDIDTVVLVKILKFVNVFSLVRKYRRLERGGALHLNKFESPSLKDDCAKFG